MSDDLVKQLRAARESGDPWAAWHLALQTADRIEKLEAALFHVRQNTYDEPLNEYVDKILNGATND